MMTTQDALERAMGHTVDGDLGARLEAEGLAIADEDTMCRAVHYVFCGVLADHQEPNEKDRQQGRALIDALLRAERATDELTA